MTLFVIHDDKKKRGGIKSTAKKWNILSSKKRIDILHDCSMALLVDRPVHCYIYRLQRPLSWPSSLVTRLRGQQAGDPAFGQSPLELSVVGMALVQGLVERVIDIVQRIVDSLNLGCGVFS